MLRRSILSALAGAAMLGGCIIVDIDPPGDRPALPQGGAPSCDTRLYQRLIGLPEDQIDRSSLPSAFRIVCHGCQVTMDYNPNRLNIQLDQQNRVSDLSCG